jgi:cellulose synthase/poly-beta-1,6-N-acetylglucosamine synthase-like glycosyltransferase
MFVSPLLATVVAGAATAGIVAAFVVDSKWLEERRRAPDGESARPGADALYFSPDTAPAGFATRRSALLAPGLLGVFAGVSAAMVPALPTLTRWYAALLAALARVHRAEVLGHGGSLSFRPFLLVFILLLSGFWLGTWRRRMAFCLFATLLYIGAVLPLDVLLARFQSRLLPEPLSQVGGIAAGLVGLFTIIVSVFARCQLPTGVVVHRERPRSWRLLARLAACILVATGCVAVYVLARNRWFPHFSVQLLGGLDSLVVLFLLSLTGLLLACSALDRKRRPQTTATPAVAFLIPAYNEAVGIAECLGAIDQAAARYPGDCVVYVIDNGSQDATVEVAQRALGECAHLRGQVLACLEPGKGRALNLGLTQVREDIIVRIDADTNVAPDIVGRLVSWFQDESVGGVSGLPLPKRVSTPRWLYPLRVIEVYYGVAFLRVAQTAADAVLVMPGLVAAYRRSVVVGLGGFGEGFNGEDADITMRIGRLGYRIVTDPGVKVYTEVPATLSHLREQRQRWARGLFHMASRNLSSISMLQGPRAVWNLPWSIFNAARRTMMVPCLLCAAVVSVLDPSVFSLREVSVVAGFLIGLQLIIISLLLVCCGEVAVLPFAPAYVVFRMYRAYIAFEAVLTLPLSPARQATAPVMLSWSRRNPRIALPLAGMAVGGAAAAFLLPQHHPIAPTIPLASAAATGGSAHKSVSRRPRSRTAASPPAPAGWVISTASAACSLRLPASWQLIAGSRHQGPGWIVVARPSGQVASFRCAVAPSTGGDPHELALRVESIVAKHTGFRLLRFGARTVSRRDAYEIEYLDRTHGVLLHHRRVFVKGRVQLEAMAPEARFAILAPTFEAIIDSYAGRRPPVSR